MVTSKIIGFRLISTIILLSLMLQMENNCLRKDEALEACGWT